MYPDLYEGLGLTLLRI